MFQSIQSRVERGTVAATILSAPGWARVGITARSERLRSEAADELALVIVAQLGENPGPVVSQDAARVGAARA